MLKQLHLLVLTLPLTLLTPTEDANGAEFDLLIQGGRIVDGTGAPWYVADIGIKDGMITRIGRFDSQSAEKTIDARGLIVAPGFVDMMGQTASPMMEDSETALNLLTQGITTINCGEGSSAAPLSEEEGRRQGWTTMAEYFQLLETRGMPVNIVQTVGHTQVRRLVMGETDRRPTDDELARMKALVQESMDAGAIGLSTALIYPPAIYAELEEIAALAEVAGASGGRYYTHMRNEGDRLLDAIDEALEIGRLANTPVHIFHLKAAGKQNWGKMQLAIARIKAARADGHQVAADIYPYVNNGLGIAALIHPRHFSDGYRQLIERLDDDRLRAEIRKEMATTGGWENWFRHVGHDWNRVIIGQTDHDRYAEHVGQSVAAIAKACDEDPWDTFFELVREGAFALPESMTDANKILAMQQEFVSFCTDVGPAGGARFASHPRAFGSFPRLLSKYVRDLGAISLERAIAQSSAVACNEILVFDRGRIAEGLAADIVLFDYGELTDQATFSDPRAVSRGMKHVVVNGTLVLENGEMTDRRPGRVLRGPAYQETKASHNVSVGEVHPSMQTFDASMQRFMEHHRVPGASVAVTDQGRLVFAKSYGYADVQTGEVVTPTSRFRIASISKPVTAVAILQLVEQGKLSLDDTYLELLPLESEIAQAEDFDERQRQITVRHLLQHRGGWDRDKSFDAMFQSVRFARELGVDPPARPEHVIQAMLSQQLDFDPGERYAYSNFGYCLLGRIIEELTGQSYEEYVQKHVLAPIGVQKMEIGETLLIGRKPGEVRYYHPGQGESVFEGSVGDEVPHPYGAWYVEAMDSHGGWIASAVDLARFAAAFDDPENCKILSAASIEEMHGRPPGNAGHEDGDPKPVYYSLGWSNRALDHGEHNHWHTGSLPGTATILIRRHDGKNFIALFNTRTSPQAGHLGREIDRELHRAANALESWPEINLFQQFGSEQP